MREGEGEKALRLAALKTKEMSMEDQEVLQQAVKPVGEALTEKKLFAGAQTEEVRKHSLMKR